MGSNHGEDMDVYKCIVPLRHGGTVNRRRAASPLVWLVEREKSNPSSKWKLGLLFALQTSVLASKPKLFGDKFHPRYHKWITLCGKKSQGKVIILGFGWKRVAINSGPKEHVNEKTREPVLEIWTKLEGLAMNIIYSTLDGHFAKWLGILGQSPIL
ncbi:hypothetical protein TNCV_2339621 [Trichonephila clavipes]|nr:hypothetical protein TNCV_2339621 [Trichonephila clavipes]